MNIVLIGFRGTGKSTIAEGLAHKLDKAKISTDEFIEKSSKMKIKDIVKKFGWDRFRQLESALIKDISNMDDMIIDLGGGFVDIDDNIKDIKKNNIILWMDADLSVIKERIKAGNNRPSLTGKKIIGEVKELYDKRKAKYKMIADFRIDTSKCNVRESINSIIEFLNN